MVEWVAGRDRSRFRLAILKREVPESRCWVALGETGEELQLNYHEISFVLPGEGHSSASASKIREHASRQDPGLLRYEP